MVALMNLTNNPVKLNKELTKRGVKQLDGLNWQWLDTATDSDQLHQVENILGYTINNSRTDVLTIPYLDTEGNEVVQSNGKPYVRYRLQNPDSNTKYLQPSKSGTHLYFSPTVKAEIWAKVKNDKTIPLILVEGEIKAEYLNQLFAITKKPIAYAIGLPGIWGWVVGKESLSKNKGLGYLLEAIGAAHDEYLKKELSNLKDDARMEMMEVLEAWYQMQAIEKVTKKQSSKTIQEKLEEWLAAKDMNRVAPSYKEGINWDLDEALEDLKSEFSAARHSAIVSKVEKLLNAQTEEKQEGHVITPELQQFKLHGRTVLICFDSDIQSSGIGQDGHYVKNSIAGAARALAIELTKLDATPKLMLLPTLLRFQTDILERYALNDPEDLNKWGVDDYGICYGWEAVFNLVTVSLEKRELALKPYALEPLASRKNINTYQLNLQATQETYMCWLKSFLRQRANIAYRDNNTSYIWNGKHWETLQSEFQELILAEGYLQSTVGRVIQLSKPVVLKMLTVHDSLWNRKADHWVLYDNGSYNFTTKEFKPGFDKSDYCTFSPIKAMYKDINQFKPDTLEILINYINSYSGGDDKFLQYILAAIRWTVAPKAKYEKLPIEKFFSLVGHQGSGKSTMLSLIQKAVGLDNCHKFTKEKLGTPEGLHQYCDRKMLFNSDASGSITKEAAENINMMVSGEILETRALHKQSRQVKMQPVIWMAGNEILNFGITGTQGLSRRLITIPIERGRGLIVDSYLTEKLTSEEFQSALFWLYRQLDELDMASILNHTRYLPLTVKHRTIAHGKEQNPLREFWEHLDSKWSYSEKQDKGFTREQLMLTFKTWAELNNQYEYKAQKIMVHMKEIDAIQPKLNEKGNQYKYSGVPYFLLNPYRDHSTTDLRLTYDEDNGRPLFIVNPKDYLPKEVDNVEELPTIMERLTEAREKREDLIQEYQAEDTIQDNSSWNSGFNPNEFVTATKSAYQPNPQPQIGFNQWEVDLNGTCDPVLQGVHNAQETTQDDNIQGSFEYLLMASSDNDESGEDSETYLY